MPFSFIADRPVLDFVATVSERGTTDLDVLRTPGDLAAWVAASGLLDTPPLVDAEALAHARRVRDGAFALLAALLDGEPPPEVDRAVVNGAASRPRPLLHLDAQGRLTRTGDLDAVLALLAGDCLDLFDSPDRALLRWCAADRCTRPFVDRSRGGRRRWCDMASCGDKVKAAAYRRRQTNPGAQP